MAKLLLAVTLALVAALCVEASLKAALRSLKVGGGERGGAAAAAAASSGAHGSSASAQTYTGDGYRVSSAEASSSGLYGRSAASALNGGHSSHVLHKSPRRSRSPFRGHRLGGHSRVSHSAPLVHQQHPSCALDQGYASASAAASTASHTLGHGSTYTHNPVHYQPQQHLSYPSNQGYASAAAAASTDLGSAAAFAHANNGGQQVAPVYASGHGVPHNVGHNHHANHYPASAANKYEESNELRRVAHHEREEEIGSIDDDKWRKTKSYGRSAGENYFTAGGRDDHDYHADKNSVTSKKRFSFNVTSANKSESESGTEVEGHDRKTEQSQKMISKMSDELMSKFNLNKNGVRSESNWNDRSGSIHEDSNYYNSDGIGDRHRFADRGYNHGVTAAASAAASSNIDLAKSSAYAANGRH